MKATSPFMGFKEQKFYGYWSFKGDRFTNEALVLAAKGELLKAAGEKISNEDLDSLHYTVSDVVRKGFINKEIVESVVDGNAHTKMYFARGGSVVLTQEGVGIPKSRISYTKEGLVLEFFPQRIKTFLNRNCSTVGNFNNDNKLTQDVIERNIRRNKAVNRFANLPPSRIIVRMADRIDPKRLKY